MRGIAVLALLLLTVAGCNDADEPPGAEGTAAPSREERLNERLSGTVLMASAPVTQPFATAAAGNFDTETDVVTDVIELDSRAALARLCGGEVAMAAVDRPIRGELRRACERNGIGLLRIHIGWLTVALVASGELDVDCMSLEELRRIWRPGSPVDRYELYGAAPGTAAYDLFVGEVTGGDIRGGWQGVNDAARIRDALRASDHALAFLNMEVIRPYPEGVQPVAVRAVDDCVEPSVETVRSGRYPLTRPLYLYVSRPALEELRVRSLARFTVENYRQLASTVRTIVPAEPSAVERSARRLPPAPIPGG